MSYDFATNQICPHQVYFEAVNIRNDRKTVDFPFAPASIRAEVYIDRIKVPQTGLYSYAELPFSLTEPYRIKVGVNDLVYLSIGTGTPQFIQLLSGKVSARDLSVFLQKKFPNLFITVKNKRVFIRTIDRTASKGFQFHDPRWTDTTSSLATTSRVLETYKTLGIIPGRAAVGRKIYPGWDVVRNPESPLLEDKSIKFREPLKNHDPIIELNYVTTAGNCRRCQGSQVEFDYSILNSTYEVVRNTDLLAQEFDKYLITEIGSHWKWPWLGSSLVNRIGGKGGIGGISATSQITIDVSQAFRTYQNMKQQQEQRFVQQNITDAEFPYRLDSIDARSLPDDPTVVIVNSVLLSRTREPVSLSRVIGNPNPFTLQGGNGSSFRLRG